MGMKTNQGKGRKAPDKRFRSGMEFFLFVSPAVFFMILIELIPFIRGIRYSLSDWNGMSSTYNYIGLTNYIEALRPGSDFWLYFWLTVKLVIVIVPLTNALALVLANILNAKIVKTKTFSRVTFFSPSVLSATVIAFLWRYMFTTISDKIGDLLHIDFFHIAWLSTPQAAFWSIVIVAVWSGVGFNMIIFIAGLQSIDETLLEVSLIDGASALQQFFRVKLPLMMSSITVCLFLSLSNTFKIFDMPYFLTGGGPGDTTRTLSIQVYYAAFQQRKYGASTATAVLLFAFILIVTLIQTSLTQKQEVQL